MLAVFPHLVDDLLKGMAGGFVGQEIGGKRVLGADGLSYPIGTDRSLVNATFDGTTASVGHPRNSRRQQFVADSPQPSRYLHQL